MRKMAKFGSSKSSSTKVSLLLRIFHQRSSHTYAGSERLVPSTTLPAKGTDGQDWNEIPSLLDADIPAYLLIRLDSQTADSSTSEWLLACYVPDKAQVRSKMLYSSTKATLAKQLGEGKFKHTMFASTPVCLD
jgi:twinfilin-like protein